MYSDSTDIYIAIYISKEGDINSTLLRLCMAVHAAMLHVREESICPLGADFRPLQGHGCDSLTDIYYRF